MSSILWGEWNPPSTGWFVWNHHMNIIHRDLPDEAHAMRAARSVASGSGTWAVAEHRTGGGGMIHRKDYAGRIRVTTCPSCGQAHECLPSWDENPLYAGPSHSFECPTTEELVMFFKGKVP